jgi:Holliday junction resolvase-like predicted endonuclease
MSERIDEKQVQSILTAHLIDQGAEVKREVKTPVGIIDLLVFKNSYKYLIEVKEVSGIKHALGQVLAYKQYHSDCQTYIIVYFTRHEEDSAASYAKAAKYNSFAEDYNIQLLNILDILPLWKALGTTNTKKSKRTQSSQTIPAQTSLTSSNSSSQSSQKNMSADTNQPSNSESLVQPDEAFLHELERLTGVKLEDIMW